MALDLSALGSISSTLADLVERLHDITAGADKDDEVEIELREVERQLITANRRLDKARREADRDQQRARRR